MVHDDDTFRTWNIDAADEPLAMRPPRDQRTRDLIWQTARGHRNWDRLRIYEELRDSGYDVDEAEVNYVLSQSRSNLRR